MLNPLKSKTGLIVVAITVLVLGVLLASIAQAQRPIPPTPPPPPPLPSLTPRPIHGMIPPTPTPNILVEPQRVVTPPKLTPTPSDNIIDLAPDVPSRDKAVISILTADGKEKNFLVPTTRRPESLLEPGDKLLVVVPPASMRHAPPVPQH